VQEIVLLIVGCWQLGMVVAEELVGRWGLRKEAGSWEHTGARSAWQLANKLRVAKTIGEDFF